MARYPVYSELRDYMIREQDLTSLDSVNQDEELRSYFNSGIRHIEAELVSMNNTDYFLTYEDRALIDGVSEYPIPDDCYGTKIRSLILMDATVTERNGRMVITNKQYIGKVSRLNDRNKFELQGIDDDLPTSSGEPDGYFVINPRLETENSSALIKLTPTPRGSLAMRIWYTRRANRMLGNDSIMDLPDPLRESLYSYVRFRIKNKTDMETDQAAWSEWRNNVKDISVGLNPQINDGENTIEPDLDFYLDFDSGISAEGDLF